MKKLRFISFSISMILLAGMLTACSGGAGVATSWPGIALDPNGETIYVTYQGQVRSLKLADGSETWIYPEKPDNKISYYAPPALTEDGQLLVGSYNHILYSLKPGSYSVNWNFDGAMSKYIAGPLLEGGLSLSSNEDNNLYALDANGKQAWKFETGDALWAPPISDGDTIYLSSMDHFVYAIDLQTGNQVWKSEDLGGALVCQPTLGPDGLLYVGTFGSKMLALDSQDGRIVWTAPTAGWVWAAPLLHEGTLYFGDLSGTFYALDAASGAVKWQVQPDTAAKRSVTGRPALLGDKLFFATESGTLFLIDPATGSTLGSQVFKTSFHGDLLAAGDTILATGANSEQVLFALDANGLQRWAYPPPKK